MHQRKDIYWKDIMEYTFEDFLRFVIKDADKIFDFDQTIIFQDKELTGLFRDPDSATGTRHVDKLASVPLRDKPGESMLIHVEVQGESSEDDRMIFGERMLCYWYRTYEKHRMPVRAIAVFIGRDCGSMPNAYFNSSGDTKLQYQFKAIRMQDYCEEELVASSNLFGLALLIAKQGLIQGKTADQRLLKKKIFVCKILQEKGLFQNKKLQALFKFLQYYVPFNNPEINQVFNEQIDLITNKKRAMDIFKRAELQNREEGLEEGRAEGRQKLKEIVETMIRMKKFTEKEIMQITHVKADFVRKIKKEISLQ